VTALPVLDAAGRRRSPATLPGCDAGRPPRDKGRLYPADPPTVEEIVAVMRQTGDDRHGFRLRALIVVLWRGGLRAQEALGLGERDLDARRGSLLVRNGKGGRRREIGMDAWGWERLRPWLAARRARNPCAHEAKTFDRGLISAAWWPSAGSDDKREVVVGIPTGRGSSRSSRRGPGTPRLRSVCLGYRDARAPASARARPP